MVVQSKNTTPRRSSINLAGSTPTTREISCTELLNYYLSTFTIRKLPLNSINSILKPVLLFTLVFGTSIFGMFCIEEVSSKSLDLIKVIVKTVPLVIVCVVYGIGSGVFYKWLLNKQDDTPLGSYIYVCLVSLVYTPLSLLLGYYFGSARSMIHFFNAIIASFIIEYNIVYDHTFIDIRASIIFQVLQMIVVWSFLMFILPFFAY